MDINSIIDSFNNTSKTFDKHLDYPSKKGIYCFRLSNDSKLKNFGSSGDVLYVGIAKESLNSRDIKTHFNSKRTGTSTLRRSLGAILKFDFKLIALPRSKNKTDQDIYCYKFNSDEEEKITEWMKNNLQVGYCVIENVEYDKLRELEVEVIKSLKPSLDLDRRTRHLNVHAFELDKLRKICQEEARNGQI